MSKELKIAIVEFILAIILFISIVGIIITDIKKIEYIKQLKQSLSEQIQEKDYYINRCKEYEEQIIKSGLVADNCECY